MPRVRALGQDAPPRREPRWREYEDRIVDRFGMMINTAQLGRVLGMSNYDHIKKWAADEGITPIRVGRRYKWDARDVAKAIDAAAGR